MHAHRLILILLWGVLSLSITTYAEPKVLGEEAFTLLKAMYDYDPEIPLEARVVERNTEEKGSLRYKVVFRGARGAMIPGYLQIPDNATAPYPCVLLMHGWSGSKTSWWKDGGYLSGGNARKALLEAGYAVFALDAQGHGDRIAENDYHVVNLYNEPDTPPRKNYFTLRDIITQTILDYRRGIDYLAERGDIDMQRIGIWGYSMGGFHAVALTAVDERIKASVGCVVPVSWDEDPILNPANYGQGLNDQPFIMLQGKTDGLCNEEQSKVLYQHIKGTDTKLELFDSGHKLPVEYVQVAAPWLIERL